MIFAFMLNGFFLGSFSEENLSITPRKILKVTIKAALE